MSDAREPVAWYVDRYENGVFYDREYNGINEFSGGRTGGIPLYAAPPPLEAPLTDERIDALIDAQAGEFFVLDRAAARALVRAALLEARK